MGLNEEEKAIIKVCWEEKGWGARKIVRFFPSKNFDCSTVQRLINKVKATGSTKRKTGSGRKKTALTQENLDQAEILFASQEDQPGTHLSQRKIARNLNVSVGSVNNMKKSLNLKAFKRINVSRRDNNVKQKRNTRCRKLLDRFSQKDVKRIIFTDEKDFTLEISQNHQNDRVYGTKKMEIPPQRLYRECSRFSKKIMVIAGVSWKGKTDIFFIDSTVNTEKYIQILQNQLLPQCRRLYSANDYIFQQDGASAHTSRETQRFLGQETPNFIDKLGWPPQSPDCNPMDYSIWNLLKQRVYCERRDKFTEVELKDKIVQCWESITVRDIRNSIASWKKRLRMVCAENGAAIEHRL